MGVECELFLPRELLDCPNEYIFPRSVAHCSCCALRLGAIGIDGQGRWSTINASRDRL
jgi:hypothetical protein